MFSSGAGDCQGGYQKASNQCENGADINIDQSEEAGGYKCTKPSQLTTQSIGAAFPASGVNNLHNFGAQNVTFALLFGQGWSGGPLHGYFSGEEFYGGRPRPDYMINVK